MVSSLFLMFIVSESKADTARMGLEIVAHSSGSWQYNANENLHKMDAGFAVLYGSNTFLGPIAITTDPVNDPVGLNGHIRVGCDQTIVTRNAANTGDHILLGCDRHLTDDTALGDGDFRTVLLGGGVYIAGSPITPGGEAFIYFKNASASHPAIRTDGTTLKFVKGDNGTDASISASTASFSGEVSGSGQSVAIASKTVDQLINQNVSTVILFQSNAKISGITHSKVSGSTFTINSAGTYSISCNLQFDSSPIGVRQISIKVNGVTIVNNKAPAAATGLGIVTGSILWPLAVNDQVVCEGIQSSGNFLNVRGGINAATNFSAAKLW